MIEIGYLLAVFLLLAAFAVGLCLGAALTRRGK
jgi:hypothetical protein